MECVCVCVVGVIPIRESLSYLLPCRRGEKEERRHQRREEEEYLMLVGVKVEVGNRRLRMKEGAPSGDHWQEWAGDEREKTFFRLLIIKEAALIFTYICQISQFEDVWFQIGSGFERRWFVVPLVASRGSPAFFFYEGHFWVEYLLNLENLRPQTCSHHSCCLM